MRFLLATSIAGRLRRLGAEVLMCAPPGQDLSGLDVRLVPLGAPMRAMTRPSSAEESSRRALGAGTTTTAAPAGIPQVVPQRGDQPCWAGRVAALGIGGDLETALKPATRARALIRSEITA
nr:hypothetical protein [uncultured Actinoplanes sp.]